MTKTDLLDRQAVANARKYMGMVAWPTIILGMVLGASYITTVVMALTGFLALWSAVPLVAVLTYASYTILHESVHGSITGNDQSLRWLIGAIIVLYLFAYVVHRPHEKVGRYLDTSTILLPRPLHALITWLWLFQNYHSIHHLFPRVPFYKYAQLYGELEEIMLAKGAPIYRITINGLKASSPIWIILFGYSGLR